MSSITNRELKIILDELPDDYEVIMSDIKDRWIAPINGVMIDDEKEEIKLLN